jgi:hypothetical protein
MRKCVYRSELKGASEAKRDAHRRGEHVAPSSFCLVLKRFRLQASGFRLLAFRLYL